MNKSGCTASYKSNSRGWVVNKCNELGISISSFVKFRMNNKSKYKSDDEVLQEYLYHMKNKVQLKDLCKQYKVEYRKLTKYKFNSGVTDNIQAIVHFRPDLYINALGEIVER